MMTEYPKRKPDFENAKLRAWSEKIDTMSKEEKSAMQDKKTPSLPIDISGGERMLESRVYASKVGKHTLKVLSKIDKDLKVSMMIKVQYESGKISFAHKELPDIFAYNEHIIQLEKEMRLLFNIGSASITHSKDYNIAMESIKEIKKNG